MSQAAAGTIWISHLIFIVAWSIFFWTISHEDQSRPMLNGNWMAITFSVANFMIMVVAFITHVGTIVCNKVED